MSSLKIRDPSTIKDRIVPRFLKDKKSITVRDNDNNIIDDDDLIDCNSVDVNDEDDVETLKRNMQNIQDIVGEFKKMLQVYRKNND